MFHSKCRLFAFVLTISLTFGIAAYATPQRQPLRFQTRIDDLLEGARDKQSIGAWVGVVMMRCLPASPATELCEWHVGRKSHGWQALADGIDSDDRITLICELAVDGSGREPGSCSAHPMRSNRTSFSSYNAPPVQGHRRASQNKRVDYSKLAGEWIGSARSLADLSRLLGELPYTCFDMSQDSRACEWRATSRTYGHGTVAAWIDAPKSKKIRFQCTLPKNGEPRADGSCLAEIGP